MLLPNKRTSPVEGTGPVPDTLAVAASGVASILEQPTDNRAALRALLQRIDIGEPMRRRAVQEAISNAMAATWRRRADMFDQARPRPGDYRGQATAEQIAEADRRCAEVALACRSHAAALEAGWFEC